MNLNQAWSCVECYHCHGTGYIDVKPLQEGAWVSVEKCPACGGTGEQKQYKDQMHKSYEDE